MINNIDHIGIAVKSLSESIPFYEQLLGTKCYNVEEVADQSVKTAFFRVGVSKIELIESTNTEGVISKFISKNGEGIHHIAFAVNDTDFALNTAKENGFRLIDNKSRVGAENMNIGFLNPKTTKGILIEFCSENK